MTTDEDVNKDTAQWSNKENIVGSPPRVRGCFDPGSLSLGNSTYQLKAFGNLGRDASHGLIVGNSPMSPLSLAV